MLIAILASHEGTTLQAVLDACSSGALPARVGLVVSNNSASGALRRARAAGAAALHLSSKTHPQPAELDAALWGALANAQADVVLLAGYMRKLGPLTLGGYAGRLLNTHPAPLPQFGGSGMYGMHVHRAVLAAGVAASGASVHLVQAEYDTGPLLAHGPVPILAGDTPEALAARVQASERELVVQVLREIAQGTRPLPLRP